MEGPLELNSDEDEEIDGEVKKKEKGTKKDVETIGNQNARLQTYMQLRERNHRKMQHITRLALSEGLGLGLSKQAVPEVREKLDALLQTLRLYSEVAVHRKQNPTEAFDMTTTATELEDLYPIVLTEPMNKVSDDAWKDKQLGTTIAALKTVPSYQDDAAAIWESEQKRTVELKAEERNHKKEHQEVRVFMTARARRAQKVAQQNKQAPIKSKEYISDSDRDEDTANASTTAIHDVPMTEADSPAEVMMAASTSKSGAKRTIHDVDQNNKDPREQQRIRLHIEDVDMTDATTEFTWSDYQQSINDESMVTLTRMPAILALLSATIDLVRQVQPGHPHLKEVIQTVLGSPNPLNPTEILEILEKFRDLRSTNKYMKKGKSLMEQGKAEELVELPNIIASIL
ncbi:hypothetical protein JVT61DRAFT_12405 [Boletus reticuloceps]|nr:hypothetical protein JVT61DRAFT_12405 [Boletus reticuloceps]